MITLEKAMAQMERQTDTFSSVETHDGGYIAATLQEPTSLGLTIIVHPISEELILRFRVLNIGQIDTDQPHEQFLRGVNTRLLLGRIEIEDNGEVYFQINHPCLDSGADDPAPGVFDRLMQATISSARDIARVVMAMRLKDARVPDEMAEKILGETFAVADDETGDVTL